MRVCKKIASKKKCMCMCMYVCVCVLTHNTNSLFQTKQNVIDCHIHEKTWTWNQQQWWYVKNIQHHFVMLFVSLKRRNYDATIKKFAMKLLIVQSVNNNEHSTKRTAITNEWSIAKWQFRSVSKVFRSPRANVSCNSHDLYFAIRCDLQRCKEPRDPSLNQLLLHNCLSLFLISHLSR